MEQSYKKFDNERDQLWFDIQEIIGPAGIWPKFLLKLFWTKNLSHAQRPLICAFVVFNGLNPEVDKTFFIQFNSNKKVHISYK